MKRIYCDIQKSEEQDDGTMIVSGIASAPTRDADGEIVTTQAMAAAIPDYMKFGAVREMHQAKAAGTAVECFIDGNGATQFTAHVVDSESVKKVKNKVLKGFSIGGKVLERDAEDPNIITAIKLVEISLVDRPNNPDSVFTMYKAEGISEEHSPEELDAISALSALVNKGAIVPSKLVELAQSFIKGEITMPDTNQPGGEPLWKTFWDVAELAHILGCLKSLQTSAAFEAAFEGDGSEVPNRLKQNITDLVETLQAMIGEEAAEMAATTAMADDEVAMAAKSKDMAAKDDDGGDDVDESAKADDDAGADADEAENEAGKDSQDDDKTKKKSEGATDLTKMSGADLAKVVGGAVTAALAPFEERLKKLEAQPAPSKAVLKVVGKGDDVAKADGDDEVMPANLSPTEAAAWEIKKLHRTGGLLG